MWNVVELLAVVQQQKIISWLSSSPQHLSAHCFAPAGWNCVDLMQSLCSHQHHFQLQQAAVFSSKSPIDLLLFFFFFFHLTTPGLLEQNLHAMWEEWGGVLQPQERSYSVVWWYGSGYLCVLRLMTAGWIDTVAKEPGVCLRSWWRPNIGLLLGAPKQHN